jgi:uncharacterized membrane protein
MVIEASSPERKAALAEEASTAELLKGAMEEARELVRLEIALAKDEVREDLNRMRRAAVSLGVALLASLIALCLLAVALVLALGATAVAALLVAAAFVVMSGSAALIGYGMVPKPPLEKTRNRLLYDVNQLKEHIA